jgi:hypothetical protein
MRGWRHCLSCMRSERACVIMGPSLPAAFVQGFEGWRLDFAKGYAAKFVDEV